jgi:hypothetical protein
MKRAFVIGFATWGAFAVAYWLLLHGRMHYAIAASIFAALFMATVVGSYRICVASLLDAKRLSANEAPIDGATFAAAGPIRVDGDPLLSPFTKRAAALYLYDIEHAVDSAEGGTRMVKDYSGLALASSHIDTPHGPIAIGGFVQLEGFDKEGASASHSARAYVAATEFENATFDAVAQMITGTGEHFRKDWKLTGDGVTKHSRAVEQIVAPGEPVCLIGYYEAGRIVPHGGVLPRLVRGMPENAIGALRSKAKLGFITATVIAIGVNAMVSLVFILPHAGVTRKTSFEEMYKYHEAVRRGDLAAAKKMVADGTPVNVPDLEGKTPLAIAGNDATASWLIEHGADVNAADEHGETVLMEQSTYGHAGIVKMLIAKGARVDAVESQYHTSALQQAEQYQRMNIVEILRNAGAHDDAVTEKNGKPLSEDDEPVRVAKAYLDALFAGDRDTLEAQWIPEKANYDNIDLADYKGGRPHPAHLLDGFANDHAATLELRGKSPQGPSVTWRYDLVRVNGIWKLRDETWETRFNGVD